MKKITLSLLLALAFLQVNAQKLPNTQKVSVWAPQNIKIDGKATDWNNKFEANNPTVELLYTIANDDKKLYLVAQTNVETVINRISSGGIKLIIQKNDTKNDEGAAVVKFPYLEKGNSITFYLSNQVIRIQNSSNAFDRENSIPSKEVEDERGADSVMKVNNKKLTSGLKWIYTHGIAGIDSLIPIYNDKGIEAAVSFDVKKVYTCEIAIDLKLLELSATKADKFAYHLVVNGEPNKYSPIVRPIMGLSDPNGTPSSGEQLRAANTAVQSRYALRGATTDFWGEYTLAK